MEQFVINLDSMYDRPILELDSLFKGCRALLDTGAKFPVWTFDEEVLKVLGGIDQNKHVKFSGFGGSTIGKLYKLTIQIGKFIYVEMPIVCSPMNIEAHLILSATMFDKVSYTIDNISNKLKIEFTDRQIVRNMKIRNKAGKLSVYLSET